MIDLVVDTSVAVKWYCPEEDSDKALQIVEAVQAKKVRLILPQSAPLELLNALSLGRKFPLEKTSDSLSAFFDLGPELALIDKLFAEKVVDYSYDYNLTSYDSAFVIVAEERNAPLFTADYKHHKKEISKNIVWLKSWKGKF